MIQSRTYFSLTQITPFLSLILVLLGCVAVGMLLALFQAPVLLCCTVYLVLLYLAWQTLEALYVSALGLTLLLLVAVAERPWPLAWDAFSAWNYPRLWALTLLGLWLGAAAWLWLLATTAQVWQQRGRYLWRGSFAVLCAGTMAWGWRCIG